MTSDAQAAPVAPVVNRFDPTVPAETVRAQMTALRELCPMAEDPMFGYGLVGRYTESRDVLTDHATFSSADGVFEPRPPGLPFLTALEYDGEPHRRGRATMTEAFGLRAVRAYEPVICEVVSHYLDQFAHRGSADLFGEFAEPIPAVVLGRVVGLEMDQSILNRQLAIRAIDAMGGDPNFPTVWAEFRDFVLSVLADRRAAPRDDFLTQLAAGTIAGPGDESVALTDDEAFTLLATLLMGGHHSTASGLVGLLHHLLTIDGLRAQFDADTTARAVIEESLRLSTPLNFFARTATTDAMLGGCPVTAGKRVVVDLVSANRDPRQFEDPEQFIATRARNPHLAFGVGIHVCPGQHLARAELRIAATELMRRLPDIRIDGEVRHSGLHGGSMLFVESLSVRFTPVGATRPKPDVD